jgi:hypothetical protein
MRAWYPVAAGFCLLCALAGAQTADELVVKNLAAKGGIEKIKAIKSLRTTGKMETPGQVIALIGEERKAPDQVRSTLTLQGMTQIEAYDGSTGWRISPFRGRRDPELLGEDELRGLVEEADFYGPLVDYQQKGNTVAYLGHATVDGDDAYRLKVTLKNGDFIYYYLDPETYLEIRTEKHEFIRGSVRETVENLGSYKLVNGVYFPYSLEQGPKTNSSDDLNKITIEKIEANAEIPDSKFKMPSPPPVSSSQQQPEPPEKPPGKQKPPGPAPVKPPDK